MGVGRHALIELYECSFEDLDNLKLIEGVLLEATKVAGATLLHHHFHQFAPQGVSGVVVIAESHFSIHTWPELGYAAIDFFTCSEEMNIESAYDYIAKAMKSGKPELKVLERGTGIPAEKNTTVL